MKETEKGGERMSKGGRKEETGEKETVQREIGKDGVRKRRKERKSRRKEERNER